MDHKTVGQSDERSGGLILYWKEFAISLRHKTENYNDVFVGSGQEKFWRLTGFYGEPKWKDKHQTWRRLRELQNVCDMPWLVIGDINEILYSFEKEGGSDHPEHFMHAFRDVLEECNLSVHGYT